MIDLPFIVPLLPPHEGGRTLLHDPKPAQQGAWSLSPGHHNEAYWSAISRVLYQSCRGRHLTQVVSSTTIKDSLHVLCLLHRYTARTWLVQFS